ncbi:MAG: hypothetical protein HOQ20_11565 [Bradyrhizobium sp.]|nr:hypothetical protein [Bradyrhizobium sp.]
MFATSLPSSSGSPSSLALRRPNGEVPGEALGGAGPGQSSIPETLADYGEAAAYRIPRFRAE